MPFGRRCQRSDYPCGEIEYAERVCYSEYIVYIGRKDQSWKVGISRYNRGGIDSGFLLRLIEQGLEEALLIRSPKKYSLPEAQELENKLTDELGLKQKLTKNIEFKNIKAIQEKIQQTYKEFFLEELPDLVRAGLFSPWLPIEQARAIFKKAPKQELKGGTKISGKILATWGKESILKTPKGLLKIDRNQLIGRKLTPIQEYFIKEDEK